MGAHAFFFPGRKITIEHRLISSFCIRHFLAVVECNLYLASMISSSTLQYLNVFNLIHLPHHHTVSLICSRFLSSASPPSLSQTHWNPAQPLKDFCVCGDTEDWWQLFQRIVSVLDTTSSHRPSLSLDPCCFPLLFLLWGRSASFTVV